MLERIKPFAGLVGSMLDELPEEVWTRDDSTFLDPAIGGGQFVREVEQRLRKCGHSDENIRNRVFGFEYSMALVDLAVNMNKLVGHYDKMNYEEFFAWKTEMRFDVIASNPPFRNGGCDNEADKLWPKFVKKAHDLTKAGGYFAMVSPNNWMQPTADIGKGTGKNAVSIFNDIFKTNNLVVANINSNEIRELYFPDVGSTFSYYVVQKAPYLGSTVFITANGDISIDIQAIESLPKVVSKESLSIVNRMKGAPFKFCDQNHGLNGVEGEASGSIVLTQKTKTGVKRSEHHLSHLIYHTNKNDGTYWFGEKRNPYADCPKVIISLSGAYLPKFNNTTGFSNMCLALICKSDTEAKNAQQIMSSKLYSFWVDMQKFSGFNPRKLILSLPQLDLTRSWTDAELYAHFGLTEEEIAYVEANVK